MSVRICHISTVHSERDIRIFYKECKTLAENGYEVYYVVSSNENKKIDNVNIVRLPYMKNRLCRIFFKIWVALFKALKVNAKVYHFHDPEFIFMGLILKLFGKKVIYDVHEDVPAQILNKEWVGGKMWRRIVSCIFNFIEKTSVKSFDGVVAATPEIGKKFPKHKTTVIRNLPITKFINKANKIETEKEVPIVIYAGGITRIRGIKELVEAMGILDGKAQLKLLGSWESDKYKQECENLYGWKYTKSYGCVKIDEVYKNMKSSDIGVVNFLPQENHIKALPNKPFEYMACNLPIVMSDFDYWKSMFSECAVFVNPSNPQNIAEKLNYLIDNVEERNKMGLRGKELIEKEYSWEAESLKLVHIYDYILK